MSYVTHLESAIDGTRFDPGRVLTTHKGRPLWVRYDLDRIAGEVPRRALAGRPWTMWRYRELLPLPDGVDPVSLDETVTPLVRCPRLARAVGTHDLWIKDESRLPTGSFKARGLAMAVSMARHLGVRTLAIPTAGNAGSALAAYAARAGLHAVVLMPADTPAVNRAEAVLFGARTFLVRGLITDCAAIVRAGAERFGWFDVSTLKEPYRLEGKKTMGLELAEQRSWRLPDHVFYPTGGGAGLIGMWKAFQELAAIGWLDDPRLPAMHACQSSSCAPIPDAFAKGERFATPPPAPRTIASGLRVPAAVGDFMILDAVRASAGRAWAADEHALPDWTRKATELEGISLCPEAAACLDALHQAVRAGVVGPDQRVVVFNTGAVQKYTDLFPADPPTLDPARINEALDRIANA